MDYGGDEWVCGYEAHEWVCGYEAHEWVGGYGAHERVGGYEAHERVGWWGRLWAAWRVLMWVERRELPTETRLGHTE